MLSLITLELPINALGGSLKILCCCLHKNTHQLGTAQHIDQYCLNLLLPWCVCFELLSHLKHTNILGKRVLIISYTT